MEEHKKPKFEPLKKYTDEPVHKQQPSPFAILRRAEVDGPHKPPSVDHLLNSTKDLFDKLDNPTEVELPEHTPDFSPMPDDVFTNLPPLLHIAARNFTAQEREVFLVGALGVVSGMLPNVQGMYFGRNVGTNLYCYIMGKYGTGKGALIWAKDLGQRADDYRTEKAKAAVTTHEAELLNYQQQMKLYEKGELNTAPQAPKTPQHLKLYLPANSTKTAIMQLLMENDGRGIIFETEGDTLADMLRQDYGNFSDVLRKAFHHEPVSYYRRANNEDVKITNPALSVVLSGTGDQLRRLIPSIENGLFSRFCFYALHGKAGFNDPFATHNTENATNIHALSEGFLKVYQRLEALSEPVNFSLQPHQAKEFVRLFDEQKAEVSEHISDDLEGTVNRMGLICFRIAMILTAVRYPKVEAGQALPCNDTDFNNAIAITQHLMQYSLHVYEKLQHSSHTPAPIVDDKQEKIVECCRSFDLGVSVRSIAELVLGDAKKKSTVYRWIQQFCKKTA